MASLSCSLSSPLRSRPRHPPPAWGRRCSPGRAGGRRSASGGDRGWGSPRCRHCTRWTTHTGGRPGTRSVDRNVRHDKLLLTCHYAKLLLTCYYVKLFLTHVNMLKCSWDVTMLICSWHITMLSCSRHITIVLDILTCYAKQTLTIEISPDKLQ